MGGETKARIQAETAKQILVQAAKGSTADQTGSFINNMFDHRKKFGIPGMFDILGKKIGSFKKGYQGFIDNVVDAEFISQLPSAYLKQSGIGKLLGVEKIGKSNKVVVKEDGKKSYSRPDTFLLPGEITAEMVEKVKNHLKKDNATRERFLKKLSSEFAMEQLIELKNDKDFMQKLQTALSDNMTEEMLAEVESLVGMPIPGKPYDNVVNNPSGDISSLENVSKIQFMASKLSDRYSLETAKQEIAKKYAEQFMNDLEFAYIFLLV